MASIQYNILDIFGCSLEVFIKESDGPLMKMWHRSSVDITFLRMKLLFRQTVQVSVPQEYAGHGFRYFPNLAHSIIPWMYCPQQCKHLPYHYHLVTHS